MPRHVISTLSASTETALRRVEEQLAREVCDDTRIMLFACTSLLICLQCRLKRAIQLHLFQYAPLY